MSSELKEIKDTVRKNGETVASLSKTVGGLVDKLSKTPDPRQPSPERVFGVPGVRKGENTMTSRGYSFLKMLGVMSGFFGPEHATIETNLSERMVNGLAKTQDRYEWKGIPTNRGHRFLVPLSADYLPYDAVDDDFRVEMKQLVAAGTAGADPHQMGWIRTKQLRDKGYSQKDLSWLTETLGGALVAPPEQGELIELLRNKEALVNAGARTVPLPPQGRMKFPRQTGPSTTYWVGENAPIPSSDIGTGEVTLQAKKLAVRIIAPNELIRFASPAAEALLRDDMTKSLALGLDLAGLEGTGTDTRPRGIINYPNINLVNSSTQAANGDTIRGQDVYRMIAAVEESNAEFEGWIMRPKTLYKYYQLRADAVAQGDAAGPFLFNLIREAGDGTDAMLGGYKVTKSTQVSQVRAKGSSTSLTYVLGGMWSDVLIGMFGAIEFAATTQGDTSFTNDQMWVRGIVSADIQLRHEAAFVLMDNLDTTLV